MLTPAQIMQRAPLCACGCGQPVNRAKHDDRANGYVKGQWFTYLRGHAPRSTKPEYIVTESGCWEWQRSIGRDGYGRLQRRGRRLLAHRDYYERHIGPIAAGMQLDHLCRNRACVNPDHLEPVTTAVNTRRGLTTKLRPEDVAAIRASADDARVVAERYGITRNHVYNLRRGLGWKDITC